ncbi:MAG: hypothetical protein K0S30_453 [Clostridia bacterium]|jgi:hypothetical protein|nr:hypothetical protein [Clostridia bacterium]
MGIFEILFKKSKSRSTVSRSTSSLEGIFDELNELVIKKQRISDYLVDLERRENEIQKFDALDKGDIEQLNILANKAKDIEEKKQNLRGRLIRNNKALYLIAQYEGDLPNLIKEMYDSERNQRDTEMNIVYLQEEKEELLEEREALLKGYRFLKHFSVFFVIMIALCLLATFALMQVLREEIWIALSVFGSMLLVFVVSILYAKDKMERELNKNVILQQKAIKYLNKSKIRYFHQRRYLDFQYEKLGVDSTSKLEMYYNRYIKNKDNEKKYMQFNQLLAEIEQKMLEIIKNKKIHVEYIENLTDWALAPQKVNAIKTLKADKEKTIEQHKALVLYEETLWKEVYSYEKDEEMKAIIHHKINMYHDKVTGHLDKIKKDA